MLVDWGNIYSELPIIIPPLYQTGELFEDHHARTTGPLCITKYAYTDPILFS